MSYNKINNIIGWVVCFIACSVYMMTKEATVSFWDCGEFIAGAAKLEVVHSPGAPLFLMLGRLFVILSGGIQNAAFAINSLSALSSGFTILFLFWTITHFAKRIILRDKEEMDSTSLMKIMGAGVVGALAYTFSDTFWFSAVEGEVYALSSFLTALVFWAILKWEDRITDDPNGAGNDLMADRWVVLIAFIMGLSTGVHLLNLLTIPAVVMVYYFKRYKNQVSKYGTLWAFVLGCVITGFVQYGVIQFIPYLCMKMDILFVNSFSLPFNSGVFFTLIAVAVGVFFLIRWARKTNRYFVHLGALCFIFILIGYSPYFSTIIRSNADVPIDMTNPDNAVTLIKYLQREQYGKVPLFIGPDYNSEATGMKEGTMQYWKGEKQYEEMGEKQDEREYPSDQLRVFPRIWDDNNPSHVRYYQEYLNLADGERASGSDNLKFFLGYQVNQMWWRYFCWNYIGRQNDVQQIMHEPHNGNWLSGINFIDKMRGLGDMNKMPDAFKNNRAHNKLFFLPFILGLLGLFFQYSRDKRNTFIVGLLFFFTGLAIVIYLNNTPIQPRERDYAYAGATYAFAIWIGLGVMMVAELLKRVGLGKMSAMAATLLCLLAVPVLMASQEWDDHDRSNKTLALACARNYLESCEPNAILFTEGDNDTYPLWYAQEVEGIRTDVRMINISLLGIDWYIDQLGFKVNNADKVDLIWKPEQYRGEKRNYVQFVDNKSVPQDRSVNLKEMLEFVGSDEPGAQMRGMNYFPVKNFYVPVDKEMIRKNKVIPDSDTSVIPDQINFSPSFPNNVVYKNDLAILNVVAANAWKRPIYFANSIDPDHYEGLEEYLELHGLAYKLTPIRTPGSNTNSPQRVAVDYCMDLVLNKFKFGNAEKKNIHFDQTNRRMLNTPRILGVQLAEYLTRNNRKEDALKVLDKVTSSVSEQSFPTVITQEDRSIIMVADAYIRAGGKKQAEEILNKIMKYIRQDAAYRASLGEDGKAAKDEDLRMELTALNYLGGSCAQNGMDDMSKKIMQLIGEYGSQVPMPSPNR
jgi:hypothetical protein